MTLTRTAAPRTLGTINSDVRLGTTTHPANDTGGLNLNKE
jgi:hypothetical protein